ncbi:MAG: O-antigen ligase family protein [Fusobacterium sp.]|uniref:O-antigen ligase family protein n=1 Tax=Fusobacterium sp. TaxID=68766 RepID=UPI0026DB020F|nr:O-antigen ligase family protein [Fusobacterium sp.]MDO4690975.1 O-antigen ligase family protein [Fusobacterium sp.]
MIKDGKKIIENIFIFLFFLYLFFLSRRGGNSKDKISVLLMITVIFYSLRYKYYEKYLLYKKEIVSGIIYIVLVILSYSYSDIKNNDRLYILTHATLYSIGFFLVILNYNLEKKYLKYIFIILFLLTLPPIFRGLIDLIRNYEILDLYRLEGRTYTTSYALELGIYFIIILFILCYYKNKYIRFLSFFYILIIVVLIIGTQSRNTFLMLPISLIFIAFLVNYKKGIIIFITLMIGIIALKEPLDIKAINRINSTITSIEKIQTDARFLLFKEGIEISKKNILKGEGFFSYKGIKGEERLVQKHGHYHNIFIETAVTQGIITLITYILFLSLLFYRLIKNYFTEKDELKKYIKLMTVAVFIFAHLYGLAEPIFYFEKLYQLIFTIITISIIIDTQNDKIIEEGR